MSGFSKADVRRYLREAFRRIDRADDTTEEGKFAIAHYHKFVANMQERYPEWVSDFLIEREMK